MKKFYCGTPRNECNGSLMQVHARWPEPSANAKLHNSPEDAFRCHCGYLLRQGYTQVGPREFSLNDGPVLVLTKKSKFGHRFRGGKADKEKASRFVPKRNAYVIVG